jgi:hypothetical protein
LGKPTAGQWQALVERLAELHARDGLALAVIDPLANVLPGSDESNAGSMLASLAALQRLTAAGVSVLLLHHPRKCTRAAELEPRGSGALPGFVVVLMELDGRRPGAADDRRRRLRAVSRYEGTPAERLIELTADGTDYALVADAGSEEFVGGWAVLRTVLEDARRKLTRRQALEAWPEDYPKPAVATLWTWLERAVAAGLVAREGVGRKNAPFRYWLPGREGELWELPPLPELEPLEPLG